MLFLQTSARSVFVRKYMVWLLCLVLLTLLSACAGRRTQHVAPTPAAGQAVNQWNGYIFDASQRFSVPASWIRAVMQQESGGHQYLHGRKIRSVHGAVGLMQIKPATYHELARRYHLGSDPYDPHDNIMAGTGYIRELSDQFGSPLFLAAYNCGPQCAENYRSHGRSLPDYAKNYMAAIKPHLNDSIPVILQPAPLSYPPPPALPVRVMADTPAARVQQQPAAGFAPPLPDDTPPPPAPFSGADPATVSAHVTSAAASGVPSSSSSSVSGYGSSGRTAMIQIGAFSSQERALRNSVLARRYSAALSASASQIERIPASAGSFVWRVRLAEVPASQLSSVCNALRYHGMACVVVSQP